MMLSNSPRLPRISELWSTLRTLFDATAQSVATRRFGNGVLIDQQVVRHKLADAYFSVSVATSVLERLESKGSLDQHGMEHNLALYSIRAGSQVLSTCIQLGGASSVVSGSVAYGLMPAIDALIDELAASLSGTSAADHPASAKSFGSLPDESANEHLRRVDDFIRHFPDRRPIRPS